MPRLRPLFLLFLLALLISAAPVLAQAPDVPPRAPAVTDGADAARPAATARVWVRYGPGRGPEVRAALANARATFHHDFPELGATVVTLPAAALEGIRHNPHVLAVEVDPERYPIRAERVSVAAGPAPAVDVVVPGAQTVPYGVDMVQARDVWDANRDGGVDPGAPTGAGITLCIIDTGYAAEHDDLPDAATGYAQVDAPFDYDGDGHGSHVAGTVAALNNAAGVVGVTPGTAPLHVIKIFGNDGLWGYASDLVDALQRCRTAGARVVSMSLGGGAPSANEQAAFQNAYDAGVLLVASAGNDGTSALNYPAAYPSVISVAAVDSTMARATFSQYNADVELAAPGVNVLSTMPYEEANTVASGGVTYAGNWIEYAARGTATGALVNGGYCGTAGAWAGKVVLCERGNYTGGPPITFLTKVTSVEGGGGVAAVIYNNAAGSFMGTLGDGQSSDIPAISLAQADGQYLVANRLGLPATVVSDRVRTTDSYALMSGTSMAAPHVSGVAALVWSAGPAWTNAQIREALTATALDRGTAGRDVYYGYGIVQASDALAYLGTPPANTPPLVAIASPGDGTAYGEGKAVAFSATAGDIEDGDLSAGIEWREGDTTLHTGASFSTAALAVGSHTITASVTDAGGLPGSDGVTVEITPLYRVYLPLLVR